MRRYKIGNDDAHAYTPSRAVLPIKEQFVTAAADTLYRLAPPPAAAALARNAVREMVTAGDVCMHLQQLIT